MSWRGRFSAWCCSVSVLLSLGTGGRVSAAHPDLEPEDDFHLVRVGPVCTDRGGDVAACLVRSANGLAGSRGLSGAAGVSIVTKA